MTSILLPLSSHGSGGTSEEYYLTLKMLGNLLLFTFYCSNHCTDTAEAIEVRPHKGKERDKMTFSFIIITVYLQ